MDRIYLCSISEDETLCIDLCSILCEEDYYKSRYINLSDIEKKYFTIKQFVESYWEGIVGKFSKMCMDPEDRVDNVSLCQLYILLRAWFEFVDPILNMHGLEKLFFLLYILLKYIHGGTIRKVDEKELKNFKNVKVLTVINFK